MTSLYLLIIAALGTGERSNVSRAVCGHDGSLVPVEDVAARLAPLPEGNDRAPLVDDLAACHLYGHPTSAEKRATSLLYAHSTLQIGNRQAGTPHSLIPETFNLPPE
jgi:hypothetical protein